MRLLLLTILCCCLSGSLSARAAEGRVLKVLPHFLDRQGRQSLSPSLYDRDAYQALLRRSPDKRSGLQFDVQWKARAPGREDLKLRVELRGLARGNLPKEGAVEKIVHQHHWFSHWTGLVLDEQAYREYGEVTAWRVTLWDGDKLLSEQKSFLW